MGRRQRIGCIAVVVLALALGIGVWHAASLAPDGLIAANARDVTVQSSGWGEQTIRYTTPGAPYGWYYEVARNLAADGWQLPVDSRTSIRSRAEVYWRLSSFWIVHLSERVAVQGEPHAATITVRRELIVPWRQFVPCAVRPWDSTC